MAKNQKGKGKKRKAVELQPNPASHSEPQSKKSNPIVQIQEEDFPRGGQDLLSAKEKQEIKEAARKEFQEEIGISRHKRRKTDNNEVYSNNGSQWQYLQHRNFSLGVKVWAIIQDINSYGLVLSLPGGAKGFAPIDKCSDVLCRLNGSIQDEEAHILRKFNSSIPSIFELFYVGQYVRGVIVSDTEDERNEEGLSDDENQNKSRRTKILVSLKLEDVNKGLSKLFLQEGMQLSACVRTVEEKGYTLHLGINETQGFLSLKSFQEKFGSSAALTPGQIIDVNITKLVTKKKGNVIVKVEHCPETSRTKMISDFPGQTIDNMIVGSLVQAKVTEINQNGVFGQFLGYYKGKFDYIHLGITGNVADNFQVGDKIKGRVVAIDPEQKMTYLCALPHVVDYHPPPPPPPYGSFFKKPVISHISPSYGIFFQIKTEDNQSSILGLSRLTDIQENRVTPQYLKLHYKVGDQVELTRMVGYCMFDGIVRISCKQSILDQIIMHYSQAFVGQDFKGVPVCRVNDDGSLKLQLAINVRGWVPKAHVLDTATADSIELREIRKRFQPNKTTVDCRVLSTQENGKKLRLTMKKGLMNSKLPMLTSIAEAEPGKKYHGVVVRILEKGILIEFYNDVRGLAPIQYLPLEPGQSVESLYKTGEVVKCTVVASYPQNNKLTLSLVSKSKLTDLKQKAQEAGLEAGHFHSFEGERLIGKLVSGRVKQIIDNVQEMADNDSSTQKSSRIFLLGVVDEDDEEYEAVLQESHLSDHLSLIDSISQRIHIGHNFPYLLVIDFWRNKGQLKLTRKASLLSARSQLPQKFEDFKEHSVVPGYVFRVTENFVSVRCLGKVTGGVNSSNVKDFKVQNVGEHFVVGQSVRAWVTKKIEDSQKLYLSLQSKLVGFTGDQFLESYFEDVEFCCSLDPDEEVESYLEVMKQLNIGDEIEGTFHDKKPYGVLCDLDIHEDLVGLITNDHLPSDVTTNSGDSFKARILDLNLERGIVDLTLLPRLLHSTPDESTPKIPSSKKACKIELLKTEQHYVVVSHNNSEIMRSPIHDYNSQKDAPSFDLKVFQSLHGVIKTQNSGKLFVPQDYKLRKTNVNTNLEVGQKYSGKVGTIYDDRAIIYVQSAKCVLHSNEIEDFDHSNLNQLKEGVIEENPIQKKLEKGLEVEVVVVNFGCNLGSQKDAKMPPVSIRPTVLENFQEAFRFEINSLEVGTILRAFLLEAQSDRIIVSVSAYVRATILAIEFKDFEYVKNLPQGTPILCEVLSRHKGRLDLGLAKQKKPKKLKVGDMVDGQVYMHPNKLVPYVRISHGRQLIVELVDLFDFWRTNVLEGLKTGMRVRGKIIGKETARDGHEYLKISHRESDSGWIENMDEVYAEKEKFQQIEILTDDQYQVGEVVRGYVSLVQEGYIVVNLQRAQSAIVTPKYLVKGPITHEQMLEKFPVGMMVVGRIVQCKLRQSDNIFQHQKYKIKLSLIDSTEGKWLKFEDLSVGDVLDGVVTSIKKYGVFVKLKRSSITGLAHTSRISDEPIENLSEMFQLGQEVKCMVVKIIKERKRIGLSLNEKYFNDDIDLSNQDLADVGNMDIDELMLDEMDVDEEDNQHKAQQKQDIDKVASIDEQRMENQEDFEAEDSDMDSDDQQSYGAEEEFEQENQDLDNVSSEQNEDESEDEIVEQGEFSDEDEYENEGINEDQSDVSGEDSQDDNDNDNDHLVVNQGVGEMIVDRNRGWEGVQVAVNGIEQANNSQVASPSELTKAEKKRIRAEKELQIRNKELERLRGDQAPKTQEDYERLLVSSPNSSYVWIQYMAFQISLGEVEKARQTAERALQTIHFREEHEKFNVWIAYLNLENQFGDDRDNFNKLLGRALQHTNQKKLYLAVVDIVQNDELLIKPIFKTMCRKFKESCKVWLRKIRYFMSQQNEDDQDSAKNKNILLRILQDARKVLPDKKYTKLLVRVSLLEFEEGEPERGRGMMEGLIQKFPKRLDLWSQYIDKEIKLGDEQKIRALFERATHLELPPKKIKFLFKRYLQYEKQYGDEQTVDHVKQRAMDFVNRLAG